MSHHITFGERSATGSELRLQVLEEPQVEIDLFVFWAVERADLRGSHAASRRDLVGEDHGLGGLVLPAALFELVLPELLHAVHITHDPAVLSPVRVCTGAAVLLEGAGAGRSSTSGIQHGAQI